MHKPFQYVETNLLNGRTFTCAEAGARRERAVARRIREARFAENKTMEGFDWSFNPKTFDRVQLEELATGDFIRRRANLVMVGWSGPAT